MESNREWIWESEGFPEEILGPIAAYTNYDPYENETDADYYKLMNSIMDWHTAEVRKAVMEVCQTIMDITHDDQSNLDRISDIQDKVAELREKWGKE